jgi:cell division septation protein DedD
VSRELTQLAQASLETANAAQREAWLKRVFANLRLHRLSQVGEAEIMMQSHAAPAGNQAAQVEVLDILAAPNDWARLCALGAETYEAILPRLRAMAMMGSTFTTSADEYVTRFCTEHERFRAPQAAVNAERNWLPLLLSLRKALKASPLIGKVDAPIARQSERRVHSSPKPIQYPPVFSSWRERAISFGAAFGLVVICLAIGLGSPAWVFLQIQQRDKAPADQQTAALPTLSVSPAPTTKPKTTPTPIPTPTPTPTVAATPVASPTPNVAPPSVVAPTERAGFFVIGMAAREEANAQAEAEKQRAAGLHPRVVYSSNWSGLTPNYYQVVYGIFANRGDTTALRKELEGHGIKTYVMHSGQRVRP